MKNGNPKFDLISLNEKIIDDKIADKIGDKLSINERTALMVGAGFSMLINEKSSSWSSLIKEVKRELEIPDGDNKNNHITPQVEAYILSRQYPREEGSQANRFQQAVANVISKQWSNIPAVASQQDYQQKAENFCNFLESIDCRIIIDLNYDDCLETILTKKNVNYTRIVGSESSPIKLLPPSGILLWKIHGIKKQPHTIVLSPADYQRLYETNNIGEKLIEIGNQINHIWTVGVGLQDDDIWSYLCVSKNLFTVNSIYATREEDENKILQEIKPWKKIVQRSTNEITLFYGKYEQDKLSYYLQKIQSIIRNGKSTERNLISNKTFLANISKELRKRADNFDTICGEISLNKYNKETIISLLKPFRNDYYSLIGFLLAKKGKNLYNSTWLGDITNINIYSNDIISIIQAIVHQVKCLCEELNDELNGQKGPSGLLYYAASQAVINHVLDIAITFGKKPKITFENKDEITDTITIFKGQPFIVGNNPFRESIIPNFNTLHFFVTPDKIQVRWPFIGEHESQSNLICGQMLTEDEWETVIRYMYKKAKPTLKIDGTDKKAQPIDISAIPPIYPCGFLLEDLYEYRKTFRGCVTQKWHLVNSYTSNGQQIVKGGGLRDSRNAYTIGGRGFIAIGEYEPLMTEARKNVQSNKS